MLMMIVAVLTTATAVTFSALMVVDAYFDKKEEAERKARKDRQAEIARLFGETGE